MGIVILLSLILMQASRNLSDAWLAHWIRNMNSTATAEMRQNSFAQSKSYSEYIKDYAACFLQKTLFFSDISECWNKDNASLTQEKLQASQNGYYLAIYIGIAIFNSLIALVRAFAFAFAGIKAAKFIHNRLLNSVVYVSISVEYSTTFC